MRLGRLAKRLPIRTHAEHRVLVRHSDLGHSGAADMEFRNGDDAAMGLGDNGNAATLEADTPATTKAVKMDRKDQGSDELVAEAAAGAMAEAVKAASAGSGDSKAVNPRRFTIATDSARDALLTDFG